MCNGTCQKKIKKDNIYYLHQEIKVYYCRNCYVKLPESINVGDLVLRKNDFLEKKNIEQLEEEWVLCDYCRKWYHWICVLYNSTIASHDEKFICPYCYIIYMDMNGAGVIRPSVPSKYTASSLPRTKLSDYIEKKVNDKIELIRMECSQLQHIDILNVIK